MPCNSIATASANLADLTNGQFAELCEALKYKVRYISQYGVYATTDTPGALGSIEIEYANGNLLCSTSDRSVPQAKLDAVRNNLVTAATQKRALLVLMALNQIGKVTQSQRTPNAWVLNVEV